MQISLLVVRAAVVGLILLALHTAAAAQDAADFYRGRTITLTIGAPPGSDDDIYARLVGKYLGRHIPGNPAVVARNMPGDGGHTATGFLYSVAPKDGTAIGEVPPQVIAAQLWFGSDRFPHDPTKFVYLGSASSETTDCFVGSDTVVKSLRDALAGVVTMGALSDGGPTRDGPVLINAVLGTKFQVAARYSAVTDILHAIETGAVSGACGLTWSSVTVRHPDWLMKGVLRGLVQESAVGAPLATRLGIPLVVNYAATAADREVFSLAYAPQKFGRPFILPPGTLPARVAALRIAFMATLADAGLLADARQASLEIDPVSGQAAEQLVARLYDAPSSAIDQVRAALGRGPGQ
jgi:tripartite-type tricarboxylate transporter receptor subunit TctC